jgi:hypothetical protein
MLSSVETNNCQKDCSEERVRFKAIASTTSKCAKIPLSIGTYRVLNRSRMETIVSVATWINYMVVDVRSENVVVVRRVLSDKSRSSNPISVKAQSN